MQLTQACIEEYGLLTVNTMWSGESPNIPEEHITSILKRWRNQQAVGFLVGLFFNPQDGDDIFL
jgi:hypothetical protein